MLTNLYSRGIFPWPHDGLPLLWFCPDPRFVLLPGEAHAGRSLRKEMRRGSFEVRADTAFRQVIHACAARPRPGQDGTWITEEMIAGYTALHEEGLAHSIEAWQGDRLVGGLYGISLGAVFYGVRDAVPAVQLGQQLQLSQDARRGGGDRDLQPVRVISRPADGAICLTNFAAARRMAS